MSDIYFWRQCYILLAGMLSSVAVGIMMAFPAVLNPAITSENSTDIKTTSDHASWITASNGFGGFIGAFVLSPILPIYGRKAAHVACNFFLLIGWLIFPFAENITALYVARIIQGICIGGVYLHSIIVSEYVHPTRRGYFTTIKKIANMFGSLCCHAMGVFWTWREISLFAIALPTLAILLTLFWPESPSYLALNGRFEECEISFKWLNGNSEESQKHLKHLMEAQMEKPKKNNNRTSMRKMFKTFLAKDFQKPLLIVFLLTLVLDLGGRYYFVAYATDILMKLLDNKTSTIYFTVGADLLAVAAFSSSTLVIRYFNRRTLLFNFGAFTVLIMWTVSLLVYLDTIFEFSTEILWLTGLSIVFLCFVVNMGIVPVSFALIGEIIPLEHRGLGLFVSSLVFTCFYSVILKLTSVLITHTGLHGTYAIYGVCLASCLVFLYKILPETKDKTLQEIEDNIKGVQEKELDYIVENKTFIT